MKISSFTWALATLVLAFIVHISMVLAIPHLSENDAWRRLLNNTKPNQMQIIENLQKGNQLWAFHAPDIKYAVCRYDVTRAPVHINFQILRAYWSIALYDDEGRNFYAADGFDLLRREMSLQLLGPDDIKDNTSTALPISVPSEQGIAVIRAPIDNQVMEKNALENLKEATCTQLPEAKRIKR